MFNFLNSKEKSIAVIGLGYVGLPIALAFARRFRVIGFDIQPQRVKMLINKTDPSSEIDASGFEGADISFTSDINDIREAVFYIIAVPTEIDASNKPDLKALFAASKSVGSVLNKGDFVVYESTVYPGCTEEDCIPILEKESGLKFMSDFMVGYSPERINPGDKKHTLTQITKVVSACNSESLETIADVYGAIIEAGVYKASSIKVAEAAKIIENTQRDINIALMNELSIVFNKMNINTFDVLEAAGTKWNFLKFVPGLVGGHCISVDPYYLTYKAEKVGYISKVVAAGRETNDAMGAYIAKETIRLLLAAGKTPQNCKVLIMGATFKENVTDIRNSKVADAVNELKLFLVDAEVVDPHASGVEFEREYGIPLKSIPGNTYDAIILAVPHFEYIAMKEDDFLSLSNENAVFIDIKGVFRNQIHKFTYWSL